MVCSPVLEPGFINGDIEFTNIADLLVRKSLVYFDGDYDVCAVGRSARFGEKHENGPGV